LLGPQDLKATRVSKALLDLKAFLALSDQAARSDPRGPVVLRVLRDLEGREAWQGPQAVLEHQARQAVLARVGLVARQARPVLQGFMGLSELRALTVQSVLWARKEMLVLQAREELKATKAPLETPAVEALSELWERRVQRASGVMLEHKAAAEQQALQEPTERQGQLDQMATWATSALLVLLAVQATRASTASRECRACRGIKAIRPLAVSVKSKSSSMAATVAGRRHSPRGITTMMHSRLRVVATMTPLL